MKRFLVLCLAALACYAAVTGTVAYFTDSVETTGEVASGNLHVIQHEYERDGNSVKAFQQEKPLYPAVGAPSKNTKITVSGHEVMIEDGLRNYVDKIVTAENKGSLNMFVRTYIAVPSFSEEVSKEPWITLDINKQKYTVENEEYGWSELGNAIFSHEEIDGHPYDIYMTTYSGLIEPNGTTPPSLLGFYMNSHVTNDGDGLVFTDTDGTTYDLGNGDNMKILVASVASQATVFEAKDDKTAAEVAMLATYPLDANGNEIYHPWGNVHFVKTPDELTNLFAGSLPYDTIISLSTGTYTLPAQLPAGLRITGAGSDVKLTVTDGKISATDVEFDHVTFQNALTFTGWGSFEDVTFVSGSTINATHDVVIADCTNVPEVNENGYTVSITPVTTTP